MDVATGWSERVAVLGRAQRAMEAGFERILERMPFDCVELHPDNGSEFFNAHLVRYWKEKVVGVHLSRSRPYQKNDNRMVEQKNDTLVRQYFGHLRLDTPEQMRGHECDLRTDVAVLQSVSTSPASVRENHGRGQDTAQMGRGANAV